MSPEDNAGTEREAIQPSEQTLDRPVVAPPVDIYEDDGGLVIVADLPGVGKDGVSATVEAGVLTIEGRAGRSDTDGSVLYREYEPSDYHRHFALGESIDPTGITAEITNGVLTVHLPKAESAKTRKIEVTGG